MKPYTIEQLDELKKWFETADLPQDLQLDKSTYFPNLRHAANSLLEQAYSCYANPKMQGGIVLLERVKSLLENK